MTFNPNGDLCRLLIKGLKLPWYGAAMYNIYYIFVGNFI